MDAFILMEQIHLIHYTIIEGLRKSRGMYNDYSFHCKRLCRMNTFILENYHGENAMKVINAINQADDTISKQYDAYQ